MIDPRNTERNDKLLEAAVHVAQTDGYASVTRAAVAARANMAQSTVSNYQRSRMTNGQDERTAPAMDLLRDDVMRWAVEHGALAIVRAGLAAGHPIALAADDRLRIAAMTV